jgi:hypothetical protein
MKKSGYAGSAGRPAMAKSGGPVMKGLGKGTKTKACTMNSPAK